MNNYSEYSILNRNTGEIVSDLKITDKKKLDIMQSKINTGSKYKNINITAGFIKDVLGEFNHIYYKVLIEKEYIFRFIYLCTYMNYKNYIELGNSKKNNKLATKKDLFEIFNNLSSKEVYRTINYFLDNQLIEEDKHGFICVCDRVVKKGKLGSKKDVTRVFNNTIQELYNSATPREHKKLGLLIRILPHINFNYNIICYNPQEENKQLIEKMTVTELSKLMGYSTTQRFKTDLFNIKVNDEYAIMITKVNKKEMLVVNPRIYYKGNNKEYLNSLITLFDIATN